MHLCRLNWVCADFNMIDLPDRALRYIEKSSRANPCQFHHVNLTLSSDAVGEQDSSIHKILQACSNLKQLDLKFPQFSNWQVDIRYLFGTKHFENLGHVHISGFTTKADDLARFLYRHRETLTCVEICDVILERGTWASLFQFMHDHLNLEDFSIRRSFQSGVSLLHCIGADLEDYVVRKTDTMDWAAFQDRSLSRTTNRLIAVEGLTSMLGDAAAFQTMILEPAFWTNDDVVTSYGPPELKIKHDEDEDLAWEIKHG